MKRKLKQAVNLTSPYKTGVADIAFEVTVKTKNPVKLGKGLHELYDQTEQHTPKVEAPRALACKKGCSYCCHLRVDTSMPEMLHLTGWLIDNLPMEEVLEIKEKAEAKWEKTSKLSDEEIKHVRIPCPLLKNDVCVAYGARPVNCRGFYSVDLSKCIEGFQNPYKDGFNAFWAGPMMISKDLMHGHLTGLMVRKGKERQVSYLLEEALTKLL